jgi:hypothetical protein
MDNYLVLVQILVSIQDHNIIKERPYLIFALYIN